MRNTRNRKLKQHCRGNERREERSTAQWRAPATRERERRARDLGRRRNDKRREQRLTAPEAHAEIGTREIRNASNAIVATAARGKVEGAGGARRHHASARDMRVAYDASTTTSDASEDRRRPRRTQRRETRETPNSSNAVVVTSDAREGRKRSRRAPTAQERERRVNDLGRRRGLRRRRDDKRRERRPTAHTPRWERERFEAHATSSW